jgi:plasmid stabilization system protein ParE
MRVTWTDRAKARLRAIQVHIARDDPSAARNEVEKILRRSWQLSRPPEIGHVVPEYEQQSDLREVLVRPYRLIYCVKKDQVDIITVLHYRQLLPGDLARD